MNWGLPPTLYPVLTTMASAPYVGLDINGPFLSNETTLLSFARSYAKNT